MSGLRVVQPGLATTVQDLGRHGFQRLGIPVSGALDGTALALANFAVGNPAGTAALECLYQGPTLLVETDAVRVAVAGAGAALDAIVAGESQRIPAGQALTLPRGSRIRVLVGSPAINAMLGIASGIAVPLVMGSRSTYTRAMLGGFEGRSLRAGDLLPIREGSSPSGDDQRVADVVLPLPSIIRVVLGPQDDYFSAESIAALLATPYQITTASDRMGYRLSGAKLSGAKGFNIVSDSVAPGAIQVPGDGQPIILLADRQTTGGYPKIATVISADLPSLGRVGPGASLRFVAVTVTEAEAAAKAAFAARAAWRLVPVSKGVVDEVRLYDANLISGVTSALVSQTQLSE
jgi:biotin-dependent carboxylase-like uncharacterized protein